MLLDSRPGSGLPTLDPPIHRLTFVATEAGQEIEVYVTGDQEVQGLNFNIQITGASPAPAFESVDDVLGRLPRL